MRLALILVALVGLAGCGILGEGTASYHPTFHRDGGTLEALQQDFAACRMQVAMLPQQQSPNPNIAYGDPQAVGKAMSNLGSSMQNREDREQFFFDCMRSKGWKRTG